MNSAGMVQMCSVKKKTHKKNRHLPWSSSGMYTGTSYQCMFQPQDEIEVGEDGYKQYDGKPGFLMRGFV